MGNLSKFADGAERSLWTVAEAAGATGIVAGYQALPLPDIPGGYLVVTGILVAGVLAGIKSVVAQRWGNGTAATLPSDLEPIPNVLPAVKSKINTDNEIPGNVDANNDGRDDYTGRFVKKKHL